MKHELSYIGHKVVENAETLARIASCKEKNALLETVEQTGFPLEERIEYSKEVIIYLGQALYEDIEQIKKQILNWCSNAADLSLRYNLSLSTALRAISIYRNVIWNVFTEELEKRQFAAITMLDVSSILDPLLDLIAQQFGEFYENYNLKMMQTAYSALEELSVPVVPISDHIAVIPVVGAIDTHRAQLLLEVSLTEGTRLGLKYIILDISGVAIIDTMVADQIFQVINALKLTGIEAYLTGIRPEIAQTIVRLGLNFRDIKTRANMQQALQELGFIRVEH